MTPPAAAEPVRPPRPSAVPTARLVYLLSAGSPLWLAQLLVPGGWLLGAAYAGLLLAAAFRQYRQLPAYDQVLVERRLPPRFLLEGSDEIVLAVNNASDQPLAVQVQDTLPAALVPLQSLDGGLVPAGRTAEVAAPVRAVRRGEHVFGDVYLRLQRPGGLAARELRYPLHQRCKVYPRIPAAEHQLLAKIDERHNPVRRPRLVRGSGMEWESLREYLPGEDLRNIDWKASARRGSLISRNLQVEKGQQVAVLIDCGRLMVNRIAGRPRLEYAINAAVLLSYACARRGDSVSLAAFSNRIESYLPACKGAAAVSQVLEAVCRIEGREVESDYWEVVAKVIGKLRKRSLIVMLTDVLDSWGSSGLSRNLVRAARRHLVLCVAMTEPRLQKLAESRPERPEQAYLKAAACQLRLDRELALEGMRSRGILVLETEPERLSVQLVRRYLEIRKGGLQ